MGHNRGSQDSQLRDVFENHVYDDEIEVDEARTSGTPRRDANDDRQADARRRERSHGTVFYSLT